MTTTHSAFRPSFRLSNYSRAVSTGDSTAHHLSATTTINVAARTDIRRTEARWARPSFGTTGGITIDSGALYSTRIPSSPPVTLLLLLITLDRGVCIALLGGCAYALERATNAEG